MYIFVKAIVDLPENFENLIQMPKLALQKLMGLRADRLKGS